MNRTTQEPFNVSVNQRDDLDLFARQPDLLCLWTVCLECGENKDGERTDEPPSTLRFEMTPAEGAKHPPGGQKQNVPRDYRSVLAPITLLALIVGLLLLSSVLTSPPKTVSEDQQEEHMSAFVI
ncbi:hypothetical protein Q5P01_002780 [Channa striata]|uniref:Uncharacterized protein n=1 Tax=Channa striata TaxID=64152 RepID=A0AA88NR29_CHASR|nr:hypothetical protein Q5P01_002780 [Channa striata]